MKITIFGCNQVGANLANKYSSMDYEVKVVDRDPNNFNKLATSFTGKKFLHNIVDHDFLEDITKDDLILMLEDNENENIMYGCFIKKHHQRANVYVLVHDKNKESICLKNQLQPLFVDNIGVNYIREVVKL